MPSAWKNPFRMPIWIGHRLVEPEETPPAMMVSMANAGGAEKSATTLESAMRAAALGPRASRPLFE